MFVTLRVDGEPKKTPETTVDHLLECHDRIRRFCALAQSVAHGGGSSSEEVREAAGRLVSYFGTALPLHVEDEDHSLLPRLVSRWKGADDPTLLQRLQHQHADLEQVLERLLPRWRALASGDRHAPSVLTLAQDTELLASSFAEHLALEETAIFPRLAALLTAEEDKAIRDEMRARRQR